MVTCSPSQLTAISWVLEQIRAERPLCAIHGLAGTGKTTILPELFQTLEAAGFNPVFTTPTHRAAMILRHKGLEDVDTIHGRALAPLFSEEYCQALYWIAVGTSYQEEIAEYYDMRDTETIPELVLTHFECGIGKHRYSTIEQLRDEVYYYTPMEVLSSIGIHGTAYIAGYKAKPLQHQGVLVVDEASMLGLELLQLCQEVFPQVVLVGDPGQLPPVDDVPVLWTAPAYSLTEVHRQALGSPLLVLAEFARKGHAIWKKNLELFAPVVEKVSEAPASDFLEAPLIVWKNSVREACTRSIRAGLGYPAQELLVGEPLVCRAFGKASRNKGMFNNALFRVEQVEGRIAILRELLSGELHTVKVHLEEIDGEYCPTGSTPFRFGYVLTCHTAQGGEWPLVYVSIPQLNAYIGYAHHKGQRDEVQRWAYTAITRAKGKLRLLTEHCFPGNS